MAFPQCVWTGCVVGVGGLVGGRTASCTCFRCTTCTACSTSCSACSPPGPPSSSRTTSGQHCALLCSTSASDSTCSPKRCYSPLDETYNCL